MQINVYLITYKNEDRVIAIKEKLKNLFKTNIKFLTISSQNSNPLFTYLEQIQYAINIAKRECSSYSGLFFYWRFFKIVKALISICLYLLKSLFLV